MKILKKLALLALLPSTLALANNPPDCISPDRLGLAAFEGKIHNINKVDIDSIRLRKWYTVGQGSNYAQDIATLENKDNQWVAGQIGNENKYGELCDYVTLSANPQYEDIQRIFKKPRALFHR